MSNATYLFEITDPGSVSGTRVLLSWLRGAVGTPQWSQLAIAFALLLIPGLACIPLVRQLDTLEMNTRNSSVYESSTPELA